MNISWVVSNKVTIDPTVDIAKIKEIGSIWGGWRTWRGCQTDNVVCHDQTKASELIKRNFQQSCNLYLPNSVFVSLGRPDGVKVYEGDFVHDLDDQEDIIAMHLASAFSDIVLLMGFDFAEQPKHEDKLAEHRAHNYRGLTKQVMVNHPLIQWVVIDHQAEFRKDLLDLSNLGKDTLSNILQS